MLTWASTVNPLLLAVIHNGPDPFTSASGSCQGLAVPALPHSLLHSPGHFTCGCIIRYWLNCKSANPRGCINNKRARQCLEGEGDWHAGRRKQTINASATRTVSCFVVARLLWDSCGDVQNKVMRWKNLCSAKHYEDRYEQIHTWLILSVWTHAWQPAMMCKKSDKTPRQRRDILTTRAKWFVALMTTMNVFQWEGCRLYPPFKQKAKASEIALLWIKTLQDEGSLRQGFLPSHQPGEHEPIILWLASYSFYGW